MTTSNLAASSAARADPIANQAGKPPLAESRWRLLGRDGHGAYLLAGLLIILVTLIAANMHAVKLDWVIGSTNASLVWIILSAAVIGWLSGITTSVVFRHRRR
jgi:uncharacterized integral membrane protein